MAATVADDSNSRVDIGLALERAAEEIIRK